MPNQNISSRTLKDMIAGLALAGFVAASFVAPASAQSATESQSVQAPEPEGEVDMEAVLEPGPLEDNVLGEADAPVTIVEYASLTCPHCAAFHNETFDAFKEKYVDTGDVRFIMRDFPFDPRAAAGAMLARCAPGGKYYPMVDMLFEQQSQWAAAEDAQAALMQLSKMAGFTQESFEQCLTNQELLDDVNAERERAANEFGVQSTPTSSKTGSRNGSSSWAAG